LVTLEAIPRTATTPLDVAATKQLKPFSVIDSVCWHLTVLGLPHQWRHGLDDVVSLERVDVVAFAMVGIIYIDPGDHRQPP
jgi:hypothetical protein